MTRETQFGVRRCVPRLARHQTEFDSLTLVSPVTANLRGAATPERLTGLEVSHDFLRVFGVSPILGSGFLPEHDRPGGNNTVVILTEELWRSRFGGEPSLVGRTIVLDEVPRTVLGILPNGAWIFARRSSWCPPCWRREHRDRGGRRIGRRSTAG